jgi:hypothetical protein
LNPLGLFFRTPPYILYGAFWRSPTVFFLSLSFEPPG